MESQEYTIPAVNWIWHMPEPLLYVSKDEVPQETITALQTRKGQANIYLLGPESIVSAQVEKQLGQYGKVVRIAGSDPHQNAIAFAKYKDPKTGFGWGIDEPGHNFFFCFFRKPGSRISCRSILTSGKACSVDLDGEGMDAADSP